MISIAEATVLREFAATRQGTKKYELLTILQDMGGGRQVSALFKPAVTGIEHVKSIELRDLHTDS